MTYNGPVIDGHAHLYELDHAGHLDVIREAGRARSMNIVCIFDDKCVNANPEAWAAKASRPGRFYVFAGLDHSAVFSGGRVDAPPLDRQVDILIAAGSDGVKLLESKPNYWLKLGLPLEGEYFRPLFARAEEAQIPLLWHVADPEEFWDPARTPRWAAEKGWGYDSSFPAKEQLYAEAFAVLERHPRLRVIFPHFLFLSADLPRASALLDRFSGIYLDLGPGVELLYNLSRDPAASRDFFLRYSRRIIYGTDCYSSMTVEEGGLRAQVIRRFLETGEEFRLPPGTDFLLGPPEDGIIHGLDLPEDTLAAIYYGNFAALAGDAPRPLNSGLAARECRRLAHQQSLLTGEPEDATPAMRAALTLEEGAR